MNNLGTDYASILMHQARMQEIIEKAEKENRFRNLCQQAESHVRRLVRINNNPRR
jgi:hypothetical protein